MPEIRSLRHHRLTLELRRLRKASGFTREQVAEQLEWSGSRVTRYETGDWKRLHPNDVKRMLAVYGVTDQQRLEAYAQLARDAGKRGWWTDYDDVVGNYVAFEDEAAQIQTFEPLYIPGLLQTEDYARALIAANPDNEPDEVKRRVAARLERHKLLEGKDGPQFWPIIDEAAIRRPVGGSKVMIGQLRSLVEVVTTRRIDLQILPFAAGSHPGMDGSFAILTFDEILAPPVVYLETATDGLYPEGNNVVQRYTMMFNRLRAKALSPQDSVTFLEDAIAGL